MTAERRLSSVNRRQYLLAASALAVGAQKAWAQVAGVRVALVIGNAAYAGATLPNAANDAKAMSGLLRGMGFDVIELRDADKRRMEEAIGQARALLQGQRGVGLLYYAGHGLQVDWRNYMVPVDADFSSATEVQLRAVDIQAVIEAFRGAGSRTNIIVLDACRDNPFGVSPGGKGLAPLDAPSGTFLAYATAPGNVAEDGSAADGNGLYTRFLIKELQKPDAKIEEVFKRVRLQVRQASQGRQIPWESTSLEEDFVFATGRTAERESSRNRDAAFAAELADWEGIRDSNRADDLYAFLARYPTGRISELAQFRLDQLTRPTVQAAAPAGLRLLPSGVNRYRVGDAWVFDREDRPENLSTRVRFEVTAIQGQRVIVNSGALILDQMGGVIKNFLGVKRPAALVSPAELQLGKRWRSAFHNEHTSGVIAVAHYDYHVAALDVIDVPAGRFRAFRIEGEGEGADRISVRRLHVTIWVDPETMWIVRNTILQTSRDGTKVFVDRAESLFSRTLVPRV